MSKRLTFTTVAEVSAYTQARFPPDTAFSRMNATAKSYANIYNMTLLNPTLAQLKQSLINGCKTAQSTRQKIYRFIAERIVVEIVVEVDDTTSTLEAVKQELTHILEQLQTMTPPAPAHSAMSDAENAEWWRVHTEIGLLVDSAHNIALWLVPPEVMAILRAIDEQCTALYPEDAELSKEENRLYNAAIGDDNAHRQFLERVEGNEQYSHWLDHARDRRAEEY